MKIISATTHFEVLVDVAIGDITGTVRCLCFVPSHDYTQIDIDPDEIGDLKYNKIPVDDVAALFNSYKEKGISLAKLIKEEALAKFDLEALQLLISKSTNTFM